MKRAGWMAAALLQLLAAAGAAQERPAAVEGVVTDAAGEPLPLAQVTVLGLGRTAVTGADGRFALRNLPPGRHRVEVTRMGHAPARREVAVGGAPAELRVALTATPLSLEGVQATGTVTSGDPLAVARSTAQLSGRALERQLSATIAQTLDGQPGIAVRYNGPGAAAPVMRGLSGDRILVLQDGQRTGDLAGSAPDHAVTIDPLSARRIEVVRGPASLLYGNNALGGVVNVISDDIPTRVPDRAELMLAGQTESAFPGASGSLRAGFGLGGRVGVSVRAGARTTGDVRISRDPQLGARLRNTGMTTRNLAVGAGWVGERVSGGASFKAFDFGYGLPHPPGSEPLRLEGRRVEGAARLEASLPSAAFPGLRIDVGAQDYAHDEVDPAGTAASTFALRTGTAGATLRQGALGPFADGAWGASGILKEHTAVGAAALTPAAESRAWGVFAFQEVRFGEGAPSLQLGARYDRYAVRTRESEKFGPAQERDFGAVSGSLGLSVPLARGVSAGVSAARAFRAPTVEEMFSANAHAGTGAVEYGNPDLRPEHSQGLDAVFRVRRERLTVELAAYRNRVENYVFPALQSRVRPGQPDSVDVGGERLPVFVYTQDDAVLRGLEGSVEWVAARRWVMGVSGDVVRAGRGGGETLPFLPPARLGGSLRWDDGRVSLGGEVRHAFRQGRYAAEDGGPTAGYTLFNASAGVQVSRGGAVHSVTLQADNLTDILYRDASSRIKDFAPNPGRNVSLVYRLFY